MDTIRSKDGLCVKFINGSILFLDNIQKTFGHDHVHRVHVVGEVAPALDTFELRKFWQALGAYLDEVEEEER